ncbi:hypothetical protein N4264_13460 [Tahibacter amnicola]|uniref:Ca2+-binding RTX toxin-like protein n=2 Tax=Tahibacter amnicola TaxID=2976241 RepID=A0ABY6BSC8_9GAMM|nr:hypothetical protein N4264_13460 [Tahibacter amnicola]
MRRDLYEFGSPGADLIRSGPEYDYVGASLGADIVYGGAGNDRLMGGTDANAYYGEEDHDYIRTGPAVATAAVAAADTDRIEGGEQSDNLFGGVGNDIVYAGKATDDINLGGTNAQGDWILGGKGDDQVFGSRELDFVNGGGGRDIAFGGAGDDVLLGDGDNDFFLNTTSIPFTNADIGKAARHTWVNNSWQTRTASMLGPGEAISVPLTPDRHFEWSITRTGDAFTFTPAVSHGTLVRVDTEGASDELHGGPGSDWMAGQAGDDTLFGEDGDDRLFGDDPVALPAGSLPGKDVLRGSNGNDRLFGNESDDALYGDDGDDVLYGDDDADTVGGQDRLFGGRGNDKLFGGRGADVLFGNDGDDNPLVGEAGDDEIYGDAGNDVLVGDGGSGTAGNDRLHGGDGNDQLMGENGNDHLSGGAGADQLSGDAGDDTLVGGIGADTLTGGAGNDRYQFGYGDDSGPGETVITDSSGMNRIAFEAGVFPQQVRLQVSGGDLVVLYGDSDRIRVAGGAAGGVIGTYEFGDGRVLTHAELMNLVAGTKDGSMKAMAPTDFGDLIEGGANADMLSLLGGHDVGYGAGGNDTIDGGPGDDVLDGGDGNDQVRGNTGSDRLYGGRGVDTLEGAAGDDDLFGGAGDDNQNGGPGNDDLVGGQGNDQLFGDEGDDLLHGGPGADLLQGGNGSDVYTFRYGDDPGASASPGTLIDDAASSISNTIRFEEGIRVEDVHLQMGSDTNGTLTVSYAAPGGAPGVFRVKCGVGGVVINRFEFGSHSSFTFSQMLARENLGNPVQVAGCPAPHTPGAVALLRTATHGECGSHAEWQAPMQGSTSFYAVNLSCTGPGGPLARRITTTDTQFYSAYPCMRAGDVDISVSACVTDQSCGPASTTRIWDNPQCN